MEAIPRPGEHLELQKDFALHRVTLRSIVLGLLTIVFMCTAGTYLEFVSHSAHMAMSNLPLIALLPFVFWILINSLLKALVPRWSLSSTELLVILGMVWVGGLFAGYTWITQWVGGMAAPRYYASPENRWEELIFDYLPWWMYPPDRKGVVEGFYHGLPEGEAIPWGAWVGPIFWATSAALALLMIGLSLTVIFQRQWVEHERLTFPMALVPLELTADFDRQRGWPAFMRNWIFWAGFATVAAVMLWNIVGYFIVGFPRISIFDAYYNPYKVKGFQVSRYLPALSYRILPTVIGFTFLCNLNILFSLWFCYLLGLIALYTMNRTGFTIGLSGQFAKASEIGGLQAHGAMTFLVLWSIWIARNHLRWVFEEAKRPDPTHEKEGDTRQLMSYRTALVMLVLSALYMVGWLHHAGFSLPMAVIWLTLFWMSLFAIMKYLAASGFGYMFTDWGTSIPQIMVGTSTMSETTLVAFRVVNWRILGGWRIPPSLPHYLRMTSPVRTRRRLILFALLLGFFAGIFASFVYTVWLCYSEGGTTFRTWALVGGSISTYNGASVALSEAQRTIMDPEKIAVWIFGGALAALVSFMHARYPWWPLHPVGLVFQYNGYLRLYALTIFLTWLIKLLILKLGGVMLYHRARPYFYGLIVGYVFSAGTSFLVDYIWFPQGQGHYIHGY